MFHKIGQLLFGDGKKTRFKKASRRSRNQYRQLTRGYELLEDRRVLATLTVTLDTDSSALVNDGEITLREAIRYVNGEQVLSADQAAFDFNNLGTNDKIVFDSSLDGGTITLTQGELTITESVTIDATALENGLTVDAGNGFNGIAGDGDGSSVFAIEPGFGDPNEIYSIDVTLAGLKITGGDTNGNGGGVAFGSSGASFPYLNQVLGADLSLTIRDSTITGNYAQSKGGGLYIPTGYMGFFDLPVDLVVERSVVSDNHASDNGGGLHFTAYGSTATISESVISGNTAGGRGGAPFALAA